MTPLLDVIENALPIADYLATIEKVEKQTKKLEQKAQAEVGS